MENRKYLNLEELIVWSDNPRQGPQENEDISEIEAINILIEVVGPEKMYNLIADIFGFKGLLGNVNPVVVLTDEKYLVYDGNRRISALKILRNPDIVEDEQLRQKIYNLIEDEDISFIDRVFVYITNEQEALEIMDKTHTGERQGAGMISWEPFQRDISLHRRGKRKIYPFAFSVAVTLKYTIKSFNIITYTDLDRLFGSTILREHFSLNEDDPEYSNQTNYIIGMLKKYKQAKRFRSFSRHFNKTGSAIEGPMVEFCTWVDEQEAKEKNFYFNSHAVDIFIDEAFSFDLIDLQILDAKNNDIPFSNDDLVIKYITPNGIETEWLDPSEVGIWEVHIVFKDEQHVEKVLVKELQQPHIDFDSSRYFAKGNTINLRKLMIRATDSHENEVTDEVKISADRYVEIVQDIFTTNNQEGVYTIIYSFDDLTGAPFSTTKEIHIVKKSNPLFGENRNKPLISYNGSTKLINISAIVNQLLNEINKLEFDKNICILTISLRTLLELSFDELQFQRKIIFSHSANLETKISEFKNFLQSGELTKLCTKFPEDLPSYHTEENNINLIEPDRLSSLLNLATHKSISRIDITKLAQSAQNEIAPILVYISLLLK